MILKGFILKINRAKNEDIIVKILSQNLVQSYYRFYGARHSVLQLGYLIDFEEELDAKAYMPRLRRVTHNGFSWLYDIEKLSMWHKFIELFEKHLRDVNEIESFYFNTLLDSAKKWHRQSNKRLLVEGVLKVLKSEGRLYDLSRCIICNKKIDDERLNLVNNFMPTHTNCSKSFEFDKKALSYTIENLSTINLDDSEVEKLFNIALKGF